MRLPFTEIAAPFGSLVSSRVPPTGLSATGVSARGPAPTVNSRRSIWSPGRTSDNGCRPGAALRVHGVEHARDGLPSSVAVALAGLLMTLTSCATPARTGVPGRSVLGAGFGGAAAEGLTASGSGLAVGSACPTAGPTGLGLASPGAAPGAAAGAVTGGENATGDSACGAAARCSPLSDACRPGLSHGAACQPISANNPAATRTANRHPKNPGFRLASLVVVAVDSARPVRRGGDSAAGDGAARAGAFTSAIVGSFSRPPRGIDFHPLVAPHAFSSDSMKSWQLR